MSTVMDDYIRIGAGLMLSGIVVLLVVIATANLPAEIVSEPILSVGGGVGVSAFLSGFACWFGPL